jgi:hypothetical protein
VLALFLLTVPQRTSPQLTRDFLTLKLGALEHEVIAVILLDLCVAHSYVQELPR